MKAMILAAGRGERMRPLTDDIPKPLLSVADTTLIEHLIKTLSGANIDEIVINLAYRGEQIAAQLGDGQQFGVNIQYSWESPHALDTGGGIFNALPLLGKAPFLLVNADIWTDYPFIRLPLEPDGLAHLVLVDNPGYRLQGDFCLGSDGQVKNAGIPMLTYACIAILRAELFKNCQSGNFPLAPLLRQACDQGLVSGEHYQGRWHNIGTPEQLTQLAEELKVNDASRD